MPIKLSFLLLPLLLFVVAVKSSETKISEWHVHNDFAHYYLSAKLLRSGDSPYTNSLSQLYQLEGLINKPKIEQATNPPALLMLTLPLTYLDIGPAFLSWSALQLLALLGTFVIMLRALKLDLKGREALIVILAASLVYPVTYHFERGQTQLLITFLIALGLKLLVSGRQYEKIMGALIFGVATSLKLFTWPLLFIVTLELGIIGAFSFMLGLVVPSLFPVILSGPHILQDFFLQALPYVEGTLLRFYGGNSLVGAIAHSVSIASNATRELTRETLSLLNLGSIGLLAIGSFYVAGLRCDIITRTSLVIVLCLIFSPTTWSHYLVLTIIPFCSLIKYVKERGTNHFWLILCYVLVGLTQGRLRRGDVLWQWLSAWWGVAALALLLALLWPVCRSYASERNSKTVRT